MLIKEIHTGKALDKGRKAILVIDESVTKPGQLAALTEFLRGQGLVATPGYDDGYVLRVRNFDSDDRLRKLLLEEWPKVAPPVMDAKGKAQEPAVDPKIVFIPLDSAEKRPFVFSRFLSQYSTPLAGGLSLISAMALFKKDLSRFRNPENDISKIKSAITGTAALFFAAGSMSLTALGIKAARKPSVTELIASIEPSLDRDPATFTPPKPSLFQTIRGYAVNNPWKINTLFNSVGAVTKFIGHAIPSDQASLHPISLIKRDYHGPERMELLASASALASLSLIATASSGPKDSILGINSFPTSRAASDPLDRQFGKVAKSFPSPFDPANDQGRNGHLNMKAAGYLSFTANSVFGLKGLIDVVTGFRGQHLGGEAGPIAERARRSWPMMLILPLDLTASYLTTLAKPRFSYSSDEIATDAADYIARKLDLKHPDALTVTRQVYMLSELLGSDSRITQSPHQLREAIAARLEIDHNYKMPSQEIGLREYEHLMEISPLAPEKQPEQIVEKQQEGFVDRLKKRSIAPVLGMA